MIKLSNGHEFEYMVASGALAFDGRGWPWERPFVKLGFIKPELFTVVIKTLTRHPRKGNLRWWKPWNCVRLIPGGSVNKVGLTNPGIEWWCKNIGPNQYLQEIPLVGSIFGDENELVEMTEMLNRYGLVGMEVNPSCPNTGHAMQTTETVIKSVKAVKRISCHPVIVKVSVGQDYCAIARGLVGIAEAVSLNSVPWERLYPHTPSPLAKLEKRVQGGGGGVSGKPAQHLNWVAARKMIADRSLPVIAPSIMDKKDLRTAREFGASAFSFGAIHLPTQGKPWTLFTNPRFFKAPASCATWSRSSL